MALMLLVKFPTDRLEDYILILCRHIILMSSGDPSLFSKLPAWGKTMSPKVADLTFWVIQIHPISIILVLKLIQFFLYTVLLHIHTTYCIIRKCHEHSPTSSAKVVKNVK